MNRIILTIVAIVFLTSLYSVSALVGQESSPLDNGSRKLAPAVQPPSSFNQTVPKLLPLMPNRLTQEIVKPISPFNSETTTAAALAPISFNDLRSKSIPLTRSPRVQIPAATTITPDSKWDPPSAPSFNSNTNQGHASALPVVIQNNSPQNNPLKQLAPARVSPELNTSQFAGSGVKTASFNQDLGSNITNATPLNEELSARNTNRAILAARQPESTPAFDLKPARELVAQYSIARAADPLPGVPVTLLELLERTSANNRSALIRQYWVTFYDWTHYWNAQEYSHWLEHIDTPKTQAETMILRAARLESQNQILATEIQLAKSQARLQELYRFDRNDLAPLPTDSPIIMHYKTHYTWYASRGLLPRKLSGIDQVLPKTLKLISNRAESVRLSRSAMNQTNNAFAVGQLGIDTLLLSGRNYYSAQQRLVATVTNYNQAIADYAISISRSPKSPQQITAMLFLAPKSTLPVDRSRLPVRQAANMTPGLPRSVYQNRMNADGSLGSLMPMNRPGPTNRGPIVPPNNAAVDHGQSVLDHSPRRNPVQPRLSNPIDLSPRRNDSFESKKSTTPLTSGFNQRPPFSPAATNPKPPTSNNGFQPKFRN